MARILFIDEDRKLHELVCTTLEQHGYRVKCNWDSTISCVPTQPDRVNPAKPRDSFLAALLRSLAVWNT